jgi:hypothetical protein
LDPARNEEKQMSDQPFVPTHEIVIKHSGGQWERIPVTTGEEPGDIAFFAGPLYTQKEWESGSSADWEYGSEDGLTFQGSAGPYNWTTYEIHSVIPQEVHEEPGPEFRETIQRVEGLTDGEGNPKEWTIRTFHEFTGIPMAEDQRPRFYSRAQAREELKWRRQREGR